MDYRMYVQLDSPFVALPAEEEKFARPTSSPPKPLQLCLFGENLLTKGTTHTLSVSLTGPRTTANPSAGVNFDLSKTIGLPNGLAQPRVYS